jgi:hypothetical protein
MATSACRGQLNIKPQYVQLAINALPEHNTQLRTLAQQGHTSHTQGRPTVFHVTPVNIAQVPVYQLPPVIVKLTTSAQGLAVLQSQLLHQWEECAK